MKNLNQKNNPTIFIVEDDPFYQEILLNELKNNQFSKVHVFDNGEQCLSNMDLNPDIILLDYNLESNLNGIAVLKQVKASFPDTQVIMLSSQEKMETATNSMKFGAYDYVSKSRVALKRIEFLIEKICKMNKLIRENILYQKTKKVIGIGVSTLVTIIIVLSVVAPKYFSFLQL